MESTNKDGVLSDKNPIKNQTPIAILIEDLTECSRLMSCEIEKDLTARMIKVLTDSYLNREREIMIGFAFDFYAVLSRQNGVDENLISENLTLAEIFFEAKFNN